MKTNTKRLAIWLCMVGFAVFYSVMAGAYTVSTATGNLLLTPKHGGDGTAWGRTNCVSCHFLQNIHKKAPNIRNWVLYKGTATCTGCHGTNGTNAPRRCIICHNATDLATSPRQGGAHKHDFSVKKDRPLGDGDCLTCHVKPDMDGQFERDVDLTAIRDAAGSFSPYTSHTDFCLRCHNRDHQPAGVRIKSRPSYGLNDPLVAIEDDYTQIDRHGWVNGGTGPYPGLRGKKFHYADEVACTDCHVMHGTRNPKLILDDTRKGSNRLLKTLPKPYKARVHDGNYAEFCVLCHRMEDPSVEEGAYDAGNGLSGVHDVTSDCTECHTHGEPVKGGL